VTFLQQGWCVLSPTIFKNELKQTLNGLTVSKLTRSLALLKVFFLPFLYEYS
jgi:hypothetical protein